MQDPKIAQRMYRFNSKRTVRLLLEGESVHCAVPKAAIEEYFRTVMSAKVIDQTVFILAPPDRHPVNMAPVTAPEVLFRLKKFDNSSPGDGRITYRHWLQVDPTCTFLSKILNVCLRHRRIPAAWKSTVAVLIYKKGDRADPSNYRPIFLSRTLYKLYAGCLTKRLLAWFMQNEILHPNQKGFMPYDGVLDHNYVLQTRIAEARRGVRALCVAWLDITNAFGSISHDAISIALEKSGVGLDLVEIIQDIYKDSTTSFLTSEGPLS